MEEWSKRRNDLGGTWRMVWRGNVEERLRGGMVGAENAEEWSKIGRASCRERVW